jgi:hypothetical protein
LPVSRCEISIANGNPHLNSKPKIIDLWKLKIQPGLNLYDRGMDTEKVQKSLSPFACLHGGA